MIRQVVVDACTALALHLFWIAEIAAVTMFVIAPQQRHVVWHLQTVVIGIEHLFVGTEHLRNLLDRLVDIAAQHVALVVDGLLHQGHTFLRAVGSLHRIVVDAAKTEGIGILVLAVGFYASLPIVLHRLPVGDVVEIAKAFFTLSLRLSIYCFPLSFIVAQHLFTMRRTHHNGILICQTGILRIVIESLCTRMHGRPEVVGFQSEQQFENLLVGLGTNLASIFVKGLLCPACPTSEALVVDKNATILYRRFFLHECQWLYVEGRFMNRSNVSPPIPRRHTDGLTERGQPKSGASTVATYYY